MQIEIQTPPTPTITLGKEKLTLRKVSQSDIIYHQE